MIWRPGGGDRGRTAGKATPPHAVFPSSLAANRRHCDLNRGRQPTPPTGRYWGSGGLPTGGLRAAASRPCRHDRGWSGPTRPEYGTPRRGCPGVQRPAATLGARTGVSTQRTPPADSLSSSLTPPLTNWRRKDTGQNPTNHGTQQTAPYRPPAVASATDSSAKRVKSLNSWQNIGCSEIAPSSETIPKKLAHATLCHCDDAS